MQMYLLLQPPDLREGDEHAMAARLHAVEKHLRKNPLQGGTFYDKLQRSTCVASKASPSCGMTMQQTERVSRCSSLHIDYTHVLLVKRTAGKCFGECIC